MQRPTHPGTDLVVAALVAAAAVALFVGAARLPPPRWEPLGSAAVPRALGGLLALFALLLVVGAVRGIVARASFPPFTAETAQVLRGAALLAVIIGFVTAMDVARVPFVLAGPIFVVAVSLIVGGLSWRIAGWSALWGGVLCGGVFLAFTRFFYINLP